MNQTTSGSKSEQSLRAVIDWLRRARTLPEHTLNNSITIYWLGARGKLRVSIPNSTPLLEVEDYLRDMLPLMSLGMNEVDDSEIANRAQLVKLPSGMLESDASFIQHLKEFKNA